MLRDLHLNPFTMTEEKFFENCVMIDQYRDSLADSAQDDFPPLPDAPQSNVWATLFFIFVGLTIFINVFPEWTPDWMLYGFGVLL